MYVYKYQYIYIYIYAREKISTMRLFSIHIATKIYYIHIKIRIYIYTLSICSIRKALVLNINTVVFHFFPLKWGFKV